MHTGGLSFQGRCSMKHIFIINPVAGKHNKSKELIEHISQCMEGRGLTYSCLLTQAPMHAASLAREFAETGAPVRLYACGGDGTLNEVANGAAGFENAAITHFPTGSGNDFIKIFGEDAVRFTKLEELLSCEEAAMDLIDCNGRLCLNICSVGLDARIGTDIQKLKRLAFVTGSGAYALSALFHVLKGVSQRLKINIGEQSFDENFTMVVAANGCYYGGGFHPVPEASPTDGAIDFLLVKGVSRLRAAKVVGDYKKGLHAKYPALITHTRGTGMTLEDPVGQACINIDGELMRAKTIRISLSEKKVRFFYPQGAVIRHT